MSVLPSSRNSGHRIMQKAGLPEERRFGFHGLRKAMCTEGSEIDPLAGCFDTIRRQFCSRFRLRARPLLIVIISSRSMYRATGPLTANYDTTRWKMRLSGCTHIRAVLRIRTGNGLRRCSWC
jgi:hypothetical protein